MQTLQFEQPTKLSIPTLASIYGVRLWLAPSTPAPRPPPRRGKFAARGSRLHSRPLSGRSFDPRPASVCASPSRALPLSWRRCRGRGLSAKVEGLARGLGARRQIGTANASSIGTLQVGQHSAAGIASVIGNRVSARAEPKAVQRSRRFRRRIKSHDLTSLQDSLNEKTPAGLAGSPPCAGNCHAGGPGWRRPDETIHVSRKPLRQLMQRSKQPI